jgi:hypothetical protein
MSDENIQVEAEWADVEVLHNFCSRGCVILEEVLFDVWLRADLWVWDTAENVQVEV